MLPKPPNWGPRYGLTYSEQAVADAYPHRPPYPAAIFDVLAGLAVDPPRAALDIGCGTGDLARTLAPRLDRVDAVDISRPMIERGRQLPGGDAPNLAWLHGAVETAPLAGPYALITAGESVHWLDWGAVFPRFVRMLATRGVLAIVTRNWDRPAALRDRLRSIFQQYATNREYQPLDLVDELAKRGLFRQLGVRRVGPVPWRPSVEEYLACRHSQQSFSLERLGKARAEAFDAAIRTVLDHLVHQGELTLRGGRLDLTVEAEVVWGTPRYSYA